MMSLGPVVSSFDNTSLLVTRYGQGGRLDGEWVDGEEVTVEVSPAVVLPLSGREVDVLPEGLRTRRAVQVFSRVPLRTTHEGGTKGDRFDWGGDTFEVQAVEDWGTAGYYRSVGVKVDPS